MAEADCRSRTDGSNQGSILREGVAHREHEIEEGKQDLSVERHNPVCLPHLAGIFKKSLFKAARDRSLPSRTRQLGACAKGYKSNCLDYPWTVCVIHDAVDVVFSHMESDHRITRPCVGTPLEDDHRHFAIYFSNSQSPG